ncbi:MAG: transposase [Acidobacteria bacterium]|nr:transposase [Acidobacteriota bacterium]
MRYSFKYLKARPAFGRATETFRKVSAFLAKLKASTSQWIKPYCADFAWQHGYTAFTVSESQLPRLRRYIENQEKHHRKISFQEELARLLKTHRLSR